MHRWTDVVLTELERLPVELVKPFEGGNEPSGVLEIMLKIPSPNFEPFLAELARLQSEPWNWQQ
jgi:hypothetical protein